MKNKTLFILLLLAAIIKPSFAHINSMSIADSLLSANTFIEKGKQKFNDDDFEGAIKEYSKAIKVDTVNAYAYALRGQALIEIYKYDQALEDLNSSIKIEKTSYFPFYQRGMLKYYTKDYNGAIKDYNTSIKLEPKYADNYVQRGLVKHKLRDYQGAIDDYSRAIDLDSEHIYAYVNRGISKSYLENYDGGISDCSKAISIYPNYAYGYFNRGVIKFYIGDYTDAIVDLSKSINLYPNYENAYLIRGDVKSELKDYRGALLDYSKSTDIRSTAYSNKKIGDANKNLKNYKEAIVNYDKALELFTNYPDALLERGICKSNIDDIKGAKEDFSKVIELDPENAYAYYLMGDISIGEEAVKYFSKLIEVFPEYGYSYKYRGIAYREIKKYENAISDYKKAMELEPSLTSIILEEIGDTYFEQKKYNDAIAEYTRVIKSDTKRLVVYFQRARAKSNLGDEKGAIGDYRALLSMEKESPNPDGFLWGTVYNNMGNCYLNLDDIKKAEKYLKIALKLEPGENYIWGSLSQLYFKKGDYQKCIDSANESIKIYLNNSSTAKSEEPGFPYYIRAMASIKLGKNKEQSCLDLSKAGELGYVKAYDEIKEYCN
jgi:tetratricopeptide (TPR) repeat protein